MIIVNEKVAISAEGGVIRYREEFHEAIGRKVSTGGRETRGSSSPNA